MNTEISNGNQFDDVRLDIVAEFQKLRTSIAKSTGEKNPFSIWNLRPFSFIKRSFLFFLVGTGLYRRAIYSNLFIKWFDEFQDYWVHQLGNRPITPMDFHYLRSSYRSIYQNLGLTDNNPKSDLHSYQDYRNIYSIFSAVLNTALINHESYRYAKYIKKGAKFLEFGCGVAPITKSLLQYYPEKKLSFVIADLDQFTFHYATWRFRNNPNVRTISIDLASETPLPDDETYDVICINTVFEHLRKPLLIAKYLHSKLRKNGILIFDYIFSSEVDGHDTPEGQEQRILTLAYIKEHFEILSGSLNDLNKTIDRTVAKKK